MYKEVAVDPACLADDACFFALREQFGFEKGRYLIADSSQWLKAAMEAVKAAQAREELKPVKAKTIKQWLNKSRKPTAAEKQLLLANDRAGVSTTSDWNQWWSLQQGIRSFDVSVATQSNPPNAYEFFELSSLADWSVSPTYTVDRTPEGIVWALTPLLYISKDILLVDNYLNLASNLVLAELTKAAALAGCHQLTIATACHCASAQTVWEREYQPLVSADFKCEWLQVPDYYFHDRYLISDTGAIKAGHGFSARVPQGTAADKLSLSYCGFDEAQSVKQQVQSLVSDGRARVIWSN